MQDVLLTTTARIAYKGVRLMLDVVDAQVTLDRYHFMTVSTPNFKFLLDWSHVYSKTVDDEVSDKNEASSYCNVSVLEITVVCTTPGMYPVETQRCWKNHMMHETHSRPTVPATWAVSTRSNSRRWTRRSSVQNTTRTRADAFC